MVGKTDPNPAEFNLEDCIVAIKADDIIDRLSSYRHRGAGSEEESYAREELMAMLLGESGVDVKEEGFFTPTTLLPFIWLMIGGLIGSLYLSQFSGMIGLIGWALFGGSYLLNMLGYRSPMMWFYAPKVTANLVAEKSTGSSICPLVIITAHLDSGPCSVMHRPQALPYYRLITMLKIGFVAVSLIFPLWAVMAVAVPLWLTTVFALVLGLIPLIASVDYILHGYSAGASDNLSGVAAACESACRLFRDMPDDCEIRLLLTSAQEVGMLGAQHYLDSHIEELHSRPVTLINIDRVGSGQLSYVVEAGNCLKYDYRSLLSETAYQVSKEQTDYEGIRATVPLMADYDALWFARAGIPTLTLTAVDLGGLPSLIHTPKDRFPALDRRLIHQTVNYSEDIIRRLRH